MIPLRFFRSLVAMCLLTLAFIAESQGQLSFTTNTTNGCSPLIVNYTATAPGAVSYSWDLGNNTFSSLQNPSVTYVNGGLFNVSLTVSYADGSTQTLFEAGYIEVFDPPTVDFSAAPLALCSGNDVTFSNSSTQGSGIITSWLWDFGDGTTNVQQSPVHNYTLAGVFPVTLVATDINGCSSLEQKNSFVQVNATPSADFSANNTLSCTTPFPVNFVTLAPAPGTTHIWNLGNGSSPVVSNPTTTYNNNGNYTVTHIVTDAIGCSDTVVKTNYIQVGSPNINIQVSANTICAGESVSFNCGSAPGSIVNWNFGNGQTSANCASTVFYNNPGTFIAAVTITDPSGCTYNSSQPITVNPNPIADFTIADTVLCNPPHNASFTALGNPTNLYSWTFGDGNGGAGQTVSHTYPNLPVMTNTGQPYFWDVSLTVKNVFNCTASTVQANAISTGQTVARIDADSRIGCAPRLVDFTDQSLSNSIVNSWEWDFGVPGGTSTLQNPNFTYPSTGAYDVRLIIGTLHGCTDTIFAPGFIVAGDTPVADFFPDTTLSCASDPIKMFNLSVGADSASWIFGDGKTSSALEPLHQFVDTGYISIMLIAMDRGCPDTLFVDSAVYINAPIAQLSPFSKFGCDTPFTVSFVDLSIGAETWSWDFDDGSPISNIPNPVHTYTSEGLYNPKLIVENLTNGCVDSMFGVIRVEAIEASFAVDTTFGCNPVTVLFTDLSYKAINYTWTFGDGGTSGSNAPGHTYLSPGQFDVSMFVQNSIGCTDDTTITRQVSVYEPQVAFQSVPAQGCAPLLVNFTNNTTSLAPVVTWQWDFGPPTATSALENPSYTYTDPGSWTVGLTATDSIGCTNSLVKPNEIFVSQPIPDFFAQYPINCPNNPVTFTNTSSGSGLNYSWDFGDASPPSGAFNPTHTYTVPGTYTVSLTVTDFQGCDSTITLVNYITIADPAISLTPDTTSADCPPLLVNFTGNALSPHPFNIWSWDFGDGGTSAGQNPSHIYVDPGSYTITLTATSPAGCSASFTAPSLINVNGPTGSFTIAPTAACPGSPLTFTGTSTNATIFTWDFNNGTLLNGQTVNYAYPASGVYLPLLILEDAGGCVVVVPNTQPVTIHPVPQADFNQSQSVLCDTGTVAFANTSISTVPVTGINWDFGLGLGTSVQNNPSFFFGNIGTYDVQLIVENLFGCADTILKPGLVVIAEPPNAELSLSDTTGCAPFSVTFNDLTIIGSSPIASRQWTFSQTSPTFSSLLQPTFVYTQPGIYQPILEVTDQNGCTDSDTLTLEALAPPLANFAADDSFGCAPKPIQFQTLTPGIVDWEWDFGDNTPNVFIDDPLHTYFTDGTYSVTLAVTDVEGCKDTLVKPQYIKLDHPTANFVISDSVICPGEPLTFSDLSLSDTSLVNWTWQFGNGDISIAQNPSYTYPASGLYAVSLKVEDFFGCEDSLTKPRQVRVRVDNTPIAPPIRFVTVLSGTEVRIVFDPYENTEGDFGSYRLLQDDGSGTWTPIFTSNNINDTKFIQTGLSTATQSYCYRLEVTNFCDRPSEFIESDIHCSILLETVSLVDAIELNWTQYVGWPVQTYEIYRVNNYDPNNVSLVATVSGDLTTWTDFDMFCYDAFVYRVKAIQAGGDETSWSNIRREAPQHFGPPFQMDIEVATVEADSFVLVKWPDVPPGENLVEVILEKDAGNGFSFWHSQSINDLQREKADFEVDVRLQSYAYQIYVVDTCGDVSPAGNIGKTILLQAERNEGSVFLNWTPYEQWDSGVDRYQIELFNESAGEFQLINTVSGGLLEYIDNNTELPQGTYCYRIVATEGNGSRVISVSNESCITVDPLLYFPNAFSPNGDGYNELFLIKGAYIDRFNMEIYNRWGEKIFVTNNQAAGWDGKINGQVEAPEGTYVFKVLGVGYEGEQIQRSGTVTLFR